MTASSSLICSWFKLEKLVAEQQCSQDLVDKWEKEITPCKTVSSFQMLIEFIVCWALWASRGSFVTCSRSNRCCYSLKYRAGTGLQPSCCVGMQGHCRSEPGDFLKSTLHFKREEGKYPERQNVSQVQWGQQLLNLIIYTFHLNIYLPFMPGKWNTLVSNSVFCSLFLFCSVCLSSPT